MSNRYLSPKAPVRLNEVLIKLQQVNRDLERLHFATYVAEKVRPIADDELLKVAKSLLFIWESRESFVDPSLVADPGWLILLHLKIAELTCQETQISTLASASGVPATTASRWIKLLESKSLVRIELDIHDDRRKFVHLTSNASEIMSRYLQNVRNFINIRGIIF